MAFPAEIDEAHLMCLFNFLLNKDFGQFVRPPRIAEVVSEQHARIHDFEHSEQCSHCEEPTLTRLIFFSRLHPLISVSRFCASDLLKWCSCHTSAQGR